MKLGAHYLGDERCDFVLWAPFLKEVAVSIVSANQRLKPMKQDNHGYWRITIEQVPPGTCYLYRLSKAIDRPDPASNFQPDGVHGPSQVIDHTTFPWEDKNWHGIPREAMIIYEIHLGTFTPEGTCQALVERLDDLRDLGINAINLMPVAQFPGERNWGYDSAYPFAVQNSYGGPDGLKKLVNECHKKGIAVILDVVYNHLGPEGNYLGEFGPYFTEKYQTPWGQALNFDDAYSNGVRNFFIENAIFWFNTYHIDALRLDAIHGIFDGSDKHFLEELAERVAEFAAQERRHLYLIVESDLNDATVIRPRELGGYGLDAQWCDDFHHSLHALITGESQGYYRDFGKVAHLVKSLNEGFVYSGQYSPYRKRCHGNSSQDRPANQFIVFSQNHDQIGNRMLGERLSTLASFEALKLAAGMVIFSPYIPLLFMGEEYGEDASFLYFVSHSDPKLIQAVQEGRKAEFKSFRWKGEPADPQSVETFIKSKINWQKRDQGKHKVLLNFYQSLIRLRRDVPALSQLNKDNLEVSGHEGKKVVLMRRWTAEDDSQVFCIFNFSRSDEKLSLALPEGSWGKLLDSADKIWHGPGTLLPKRLSSQTEINIRGISFAAYAKEEIS